MKVISHSRNGERDYCRQRYWRVDEADAIARNQWEGAGNVLDLVMGDKLTLHKCRAARGCITLTAEQWANRPLQQIKRWRTREKTERRRTWRNLNTCFYKPFYKTFSLNDSCRPPFLSLYCQNGLCFMWCRHTEHTHPGSLWKFPTILFVLVILSQQ